MLENSGEFSHAYEIEELLHIASAVAERQLQDMEAAQSIASEITGQPAPEVPLELRHKLVTATAAMNITRLETPEACISFETGLDAVMEGSYGLLADMDSADGEAIPESQIRQFMINFGNTMLNEMGVKEETTSGIFAKTFMAAKVIAEQKGVGVAQVYQDEELYSETFRQAYTLVEFATQQLAMMDGISEKTMGSLFVHMLSIIIPEEEQAEMDEEEMAEMIAELQLDTEVQTALTEATELGLKVARHVAVSQIIRFWGSDSLRDLPKEIKQKLEITDKPSVIQIGGLVILGASAEQADQLKMRESFVNRYFEERDWDASNPTMEQVMEVRSQPGWQNPST